MATDLSPGDAAAPRLEVSGITRSFGSVEVLRGADLMPADGEFVTILGPSGSGKTTLLRIIAGFERPDGGVVRISGRVMSDGRHGIVVPPERRELGMVFQSYAIWPHLTVEKNVSYPLKLRRWSRADIRRRVDEVLSLVALNGLEQRLPSQLSGGQQQRVALARALAPKPDLLLLDEPMSNLDAKLRERMRRDLRLIQKELKLTTILVTHDQTEAIELSDSIVVIHEGLVQQVGTPDQLYREPANAFVAGFLGDANVVPGEGGADGAWHFEGGGKLRNECQPPDDALLAVIRPEDVRLIPGGDTARVRTRVFSGPVVNYVLDLAGTELLAMTSTDVDIAEGDFVGVDARRIHYLRGGRDAGSGNEEIAIETKES